MKLIAPLNQNKIKQDIGLYPMGDGPLPFTVVLIMPDDTKGVQYGDEMLPIGFVKSDIWDEDKFHVFDIRGKRLFKEQSPSFSDKVKPRRYEVEKNNFFLVLWPNDSDFKLREWGILHQESRLVNLTIQIYMEQINEPN